MTRATEIVKALSANDVGETGGHQAGVLVPKSAEILSFFPTLSAKEKNPRVRLVFRDEDGLTRWEFVFIYYNNKFFGGTRNEYRLTCMTKYLRSRNAKVGDEIVLSRTPDDRLSVRHIRSAQSNPTFDGDVLVLSSGWKIISIK